MGESLDEGFSPDVYNMDYDKESDKVTGEVEVFGADRDGGEMSLDVEFVYDVAKGELRILSDYHSEGMEIDAYFDDDDVHQQVQDEVAEYLEAVGALGEDVEVSEKLVKDAPGEGHFDGEVDCETEFDDTCYNEVEEDIAGIDPEVEAAILDLAMALGLEDADQDDAEVIGKKLDVPPSDVHKVINQDLTQESKK